MAYKGKIESGKYTHVCGDIREVTVRVGKIFVHAVDGHGYPWNEDSFRSCWSPAVTPGSAPARPKPERRLAQGWTRDDSGWVCTDRNGNGGCQINGTRTVAIYYKDDETCAGACEACAETNGVFADAPAQPPAPRQPDPRPSGIAPKQVTSPIPVTMEEARRIRLDYDRSGIVSFGVRVICSCGCSKCFVTTPCEACTHGPRSIFMIAEALRGPKIVGKYNDDGRHVFSGPLSWERDARDTLLANLARERPPARPATKVRDIYLVPCDPDCDVGSDV